MLSIPPRWVSSTAKRDLPSPRARKSISTGHDTPLTDTHVDASPTVQADASSNHQTNPGNSQTSSDKDANSAPSEEGKGQLVDYSI